MQKMIKQNLNQTYVKKKVNKKHRSKDKENALYNTEML